MTTAHQVKQIYRPLINNDPSLRETSNRLLSITPVRHFVASIFIERSGDANTCWPMLAISALFFSRISHDIAIGTYNENLDRPASSSERFWLWSDADMVTDAMTAIETVAIPKLRFYGTPEGYATLPRREHQAHFEPLEDRMLVHIAAGDLETARTLWHEKEPSYRGKTFHPDSRPHSWQTQLEAVREPLLAGDRQALARILHDWEAANVRGTSIERYWEPTPFPLEL